MKKIEVSKFISECPICLSDFKEGDLICEFPCHSSH